MVTQLAVRRILGTAVFGGLAVYMGSHAGYAGVLAVRPSPFQGQGVRIPSGLRGRVDIERNANSHEPGATAQLGRRAGGR